MDALNSASFIVEKEPYYLNSGDEAALFESAWLAKLR